MDGLPIARKRYVLEPPRSVLGLLGRDEGPSRPPLDPPDPGSHEMATRESAKRVVGKNSR